VDGTLKNNIIFKEQRNIIDDIVHSGGEER